MQRGGGWSDIKRPDLFSKPVLITMQSSALLFCVVLFLSGSGSYASSCNECCYYIPSPDYYWRPYDGVIPHDAVEGGLNGNNVTFVGQIPAKTSSGVIPAIIYPGERAAEGVYVGSYRHDEYVKILCSARKDRLKWIRTKVEDLHLLTDYHIIVGGYEGIEGKLWKLYIGRVNHDNRVIVGKVFNVTSVFKGLRIPANNQEVVYSEFEILVYRR